MTYLHPGESALLALQAGAWLSSGALIGAFYFGMLRWNVRLLVLGRTPLLAMILQVGRFALLAGVLAATASRFGAFPLLVAAVGIFLARAVAMRLGAPT
jgi:F1F0 ATPase subunit 2